MLFNTGDFRPAISIIFCMESAKGGDGNIAPNR